MSRLGLGLLICWAALPQVVDAHAEVRTKSGGFISLAQRAFYPDDNATTEDYGLALEGQLEFKLKTGGFRHQLEVFGRAAGLDQSRSIYFAKEAWIGYVHERFELRIGAHVLNWTATEAFHPSDIINSRNLDSSIENADKIGEPMASLRLRFLNGGITGYFMPIRMEPRLPGPRSRLNLTGGQPVGETLYVDGDGQIDDDRFAPQWAVRADQTFGSADLAAYFVRHQDRTQPGVFIDLETMQGRPLFPWVERIGGTYTHALGEWIVKVEADHRRFTRPSEPAPLMFVQPLPIDHTAVAAGLEWGWGYDSGSEGTIIAEGQFAIAADAGEGERQRLGPFENDILIGYRHAANDEHSTEWNVGVIVDTKRPNEVLGNASFSRRLSDTWVLKSTARFIHAPDTTSLLNALHKAHALQLDLIRYF